MTHFPNSLLRKILPQAPTATPSEVLWGAGYTAESAAKNLCNLVESTYGEQAEQIIVQIVERSPGAVEGSIRERIVRLRAIADYYNDVAAQIERGEFEIE